MKNVLFYIFGFISFFGNSQDSIKDILTKYNNNSIPYISVEDLAMLKTKAILFDAREPEEYSVSHLENAICVGSNNFDIASIEKEYTNKNEKIIVYCSLGVRSEIIGEKLKKAGYTNIYNLYGGIFEWKNNNCEVVNSENKKTEKIHVYNKHWSKWLKKGKKIY